MVTGLGWVVAALAVGLWWGERGRRRAAERYAATGQVGPGGGRRVAVPPSTEALVRQPVPAPDPDLTAAGATWLARRARQVGIPLPAGAAERAAGDLLRRARGD